MSTLDSLQADILRLRAELEARKVSGQKPANGDWIEAMDTASGASYWYPVEWYNELRVVELRLRGIEPPLDAELQAAQHRLAAHYAAQRHNLLPDEDRAYLSMMGKMQTMAEFLALPPDQAAKLPATGEGSMTEAQKMAKAMVVDVDSFLECA